MADSENMSDVELKHKKEKKELQSKIQSLKKTVGKGDKKKKKEIMDEILRLETEMESRHLAELHIFDNTVQSESEVNILDLQTQDELVPRVSKAQKRRDKKLAEEKAREEVILKQEEENIFGPRNVENQTIKKFLSEKGLCLYEIPSDGDCLYGAIVHQLCLICKPMDVDRLRKLTSCYIRENKDKFIPFLLNLDSGELLTDEQFEEYCCKIASTKAWGGQVELQAISELMKCRINVLQSSAPSIITQGVEFEGPPLLITYHRHMYGLGEHYNSTQTLIEDDTISIL